ncbi:MAG: NAD-dependent epimerase/dehydratase family protein [Myxococcota bacterium]
MEELQLHVIFGTGQVGPVLGRELKRQGHRVRLVSRRPNRALGQGPVGPDSASPPDGGGAPEPSRGWELMAADATDPKAVDRACAGATTIYNCANPPYHRWRELLVPLFTAIRDGAERAEAKHVVLDNLYMYGRPPAESFDERTPIAPCSMKGKLRAELHEALFKAHTTGRIRAVSAHASDFFGPDAPRSLFSERFFHRLARGKAVEVFGDPEFVHGYSYIPDVARGLAAIGTDDAALGRSWHLPVAWTKSTAELVAAFAKYAGVEPRMTRMSSGLLRLLGIVMPEARGIPEMLYQWEQPFLPSDQDFRKRFFPPTSADDAVRETATQALGLLTPPSGRSDETP